MIDWEHIAQGLGLAALLGCSVPAHAETSASFQVSAEVSSGCEIDQVLAVGGEDLGQYGSLDFGAHSALATGAATAVVSQTSSLSLICTPGVSLAMTLDGGLHGAAERNMMADGDSTLQPYQLFRDPGLTQELEIDQPVAVFIADPDAVSLPIYGKAILTGDKSPGTYSDTIHLTLSW